MANEATTDEPLVDDEVYYSEEDTDEDIPTEKEDLQKRVKELKKVSNMRERKYLVLLFRNLY